MLSQRLLAGILLWTALFLTSTAFVYGLYAWKPLTSAKLGSSFNQRMLMLKDVAGYKNDHNLPIDDLKQEERVMARSSSKAEAEGIDPESIKPFVRTQMEVAKAIERRFIEVWKSKPENGWKPKPLEEVRKEIASVDETILKLIHDKLADEGGYSEQDRRIIYSYITAPKVTQTDKQQLTDALFGVKLKKAVSSVAS